LTGVPCISGSPSAGFFSIILIVAQTAGIRGLCVLLALIACACLALSSARERSSCEWTGAP
jgi:hypothetical protein